MKRVLFVIAVIAAATMAFRPVPLKKAKVYLFLQTQCPCIYNHKETFGSLIKAYQSKVSFTAVFTGRKENDKDIRQLISDLGWDLPYIKDNDHKLLQKWRPKVSTDCVLVDEKGNVLYLGTIDDGPLNMGTVKNFYLKDALEAYLNNLPIKVSSAKGIGCSLGY
ncbi:MULTISPECIES: thioredoxin domain-containing protein [Niastella]|uniref:Alkyl hydroperoxide reductase subunit C/ Thiol specific antioxidant domain-containing protein n=1 Tax=Niastella soli TaxID=2821487 RepID=A0ABS3YT42_9BACT|nr:hypothetical protein [Niastella soli]MBO9201033.1 hypothetical protein [Niastella soli]